MAVRKINNAGHTIRPFSTVFSQEDVRQIDRRIMNAQKKHTARVLRAMANAEDFVMTH